MAEAPFLERIFAIDGVEVPCRFFRPSREGADYVCRYEICSQDLGPRDVCGVDGVQALLLAIQGAAADLLALVEDDEKRITWLGGDGLGLPFSSSFDDFTRK